MMENSTLREDLMRTRKATWAGVAVFCVLVAAGCATSESGFSDLESEPSEADVLPAVILDSVGPESPMDPDSVRFVKDYGGVSFWVAAGKSTAIGCLIVYPNDQEWVVGCGGSIGETKLSGPSGTYSLVPDGTSPSKESAVQISKNVYSLSD
ncbi:MAG: hypothetical protein ACTIJ6_03070 [Leucobacter sp.]